jgi:predicted DNA-binding transcriptional regulator AlpA
MKSIPTLLRYADLKARGVVSSRQQLKNLVEKYGFPPGRLLSANTRVWTDEEYAAWLDSRPTKGAKAPLRGNAAALKAKSEGKKAREADNEVAA